jgi:NarL family two-component system response regulator LiaR
VTSIALIDDHPLATNGIGAWLNGTGRFTICGTAKNLAEASALMEKLENPPEIIILDISLGAEDGLDFIPMLKEICAKRNAPVPGILVCSMYEDPFLIQHAMDSGAKAYVPKSAESGEILTAIDALLKGGSYINPRYRVRTPKHSWSILTGRENEIVACIKQNMNNRQIAKRLNIAVRTVENHISHIYVKTGAASREELLEL